MTTIASCLLALCLPTGSTPAVDETFAFAGTNMQAPNQNAVDPPLITITRPQADPRAIERASQPINAASALAEEGLQIGNIDVLKGGKLLLTNGISTLEGASGGGIARWSTIAGRQMPGGIGLTGHITAIELADFGWRSYGAALGFGDRLELSFARADFDTRDTGARLGLGQGYTFNQEVLGAKLRVAGDLVYDKPWLPQIAVGIEHKRSRDAATVRSLGAADAKGTDYTISATRLWLQQSLLVNAPCATPRPTSSACSALAARGAPATTCNSKARWATKCHDAR